MLLEIFPRRYSWLGAWVRSRTYTCLQVCMCVCVCACVRVCVCACVRVWYTLVESITNLTGTSFSSLTGHRCYCSNLCYDYTDRSTRSVCHTSCRKLSLCPSHIVCLFPSTLFPLPPLPSVRFVFEYADLYRATSKNIWNQVHHNLLLCVFLLLGLWIWRSNRPRPLHFVLETFSLQGGEDA